MNNPRKKDYNSHVCRNAAVIVITMLCITGAFTSLDVTVTGASTDIAWNVTMNFTELDGKYDYVIFGEAPDAYDGSQADSYDTPKSPPPPSAPYILVWFDNDLPSPHNKLWYDYRKYPDVSKVWDLYVRWAPSDDISPTDITISWSMSEVVSSEYSSVELYDYDNDIVVAEMTRYSTCEYTASAGIHHFQITATNNPPNTPNNLNPTDGATDVSVDVDLSWTGGDPDEGDIVTYDVYFGITTSPQKILSNQSTTTHDHSTLDYDTTYYWKIVAWDNHDASTSGPIWSFTTESTGNGGNGGNNGNGGNGDGTTNQPPVANASAGEPYQGFVNSEILFNGILSNDRDGFITSWHWDFGDGTNGSGEITIHVYSEIDIYTVTLTVTDDDGFTDTDTVNVEIVKANNPPTKPQVQGLTTGSKNTEYTYTAVSTDEDNDTIQYIFNWDDGTNTTTDFLPNGTMTTQRHSWNEAGIYMITVRVTDNITISGETKKTVLIDAYLFGDLGYFIDNNGDGIYDLFCNDTAKIETAVEQQGNGTYLIDINGDKAWDFYYDQVSGTITPFTEEETKEEGFLPFIALIVIALAIIAAIVYFYKKEYF